MFVFPVYPGGRPVTLVPHGGDGRARVPRAEEEVHLGPRDAFNRRVDPPDGGLRPPQSRSSSSTMTAMMSAMIAMVRVFTGSPFVCGRSQAAPDIRR
jgi:hypothetical protein